MRNFEMEMNYNKGQLMKRAINVAEIAGRNWNFIEDFYPSQNSNVEWHYYSATSKNLLEKLISRPKISRYRACLQSTLQIHNKDDVVISHMPRMTHWQSVFMKTLGRNNPHIAFSFNFTELPGSPLRSAMIKSFSRVDSFVVYSQFERNLYSEYFEIPIEKIHMLHWAMDKPNVDEEFIPMDDSYYCAVGGEGRDYKTLILAFERLKHLNLVIVTRHYAMDGLKIPSNVKVFYNLPNDKFWGVVDKSKAMIVPLRDDNTACGHITLVGAMKLRKPIVTTFSHGTTDYISANENGLICPPQDVDCLVDAIETLEFNPHLSGKLGEHGYEFASEYCNPIVWAKFIHRFIDR